MALVALSGSDVTQINDRVLADFADDNIAELVYQTDIANVKTGKNGNSLFSLNESGKQADFNIRLIRGSSDDRYLSGLLAAQMANFAAFVLMTGKFIKNIGDGAGNILRDTYVLSGGVFVRPVDAKSNVTGDTEQSVSIYRMKFTNAPRVIS